MNMVRTGDFRMISKSGQFSSCAGISIEANALGELKAGSVIVQPDHVRTTAGTSLDFQAKIHYRGHVFGDRSFQVIRLFGTSVHTNLEAVLIMLATGFAGSSWLHAALIVIGFAVGTGLHLGSHWLVALAFGQHSFGCR
jgi:hypothetical protein